MKFRTLIALLFALFVISRADAEQKKTLFDLSARSITGEVVSFAKYKGKVVLISNTALMCGTTPQLADLQVVYEEFKDRGLVVLGFPSNDFTQVEPKDPKEVKSACERRFGVSFPLFEQGPVRGDEMNEVFSFLTHEASDKKMRGEVGFNFEKFLIGKDGKLRKRYGSFTGALSRVMREDIERLLAE